MAFHAYQTAGQSINAGSTTKLNFSTEVYDTNNNFDLTNDRFTPAVAGKYIFTANASLFTLAAARTGQVVIYKNGAALSWGSMGPGAGAGHTDDSVATVVADANGTTDYFEAFLLNTDTAARTTAASGLADINFTGAMLQGVAGGLDNLGNHTATTNIQLGANWLSGDGGAEGLRVDASGNVGVGIAAPSDNFHVKTSQANVNQSFTISTPLSWSGTSGISLNSVTDTNSANREMEFNASVFGFLTGDVGIGTATPGAPLHVDSFYSFPQLRL